jgi:hypothetical protein
MTQARTTHAALVVYEPTDPALSIEFELNPESLTRTRTWQVDGSTSRALRAEPFESPADTARVTQGAVPSAESLTFTVLLDATDRLQAGDPVTGTLGIQPELDLLDCMAAPKVHGPDGAQVLSGLGLGGRRGFAREETLSILLFVWGERTFPVLLTSLKVEEQAHLPSLYPYRATVTVTLEVIESANQFYTAEAVRRSDSARRASTQRILPAAGDRAAERSAR